MALRNVLKGKISSNFDIEILRLLVVVNFQLRLRISNASKDPDESLPFNNQPHSRLLNTIEITMISNVTVPVILTPSTS